MSNEQLRQALTGAGLTHEQVAGKLGVDPKTVQRWVTLGRVPHPRHRRGLAELINRNERELWPSSDRTNGAPELIRLFPERGAVPRDRWLGLLSHATESVDVLAWAATFFNQIQSSISTRLSSAVARGVRVRLCFGDPTSDAVAVREAEEPLLGKDVLAGKIRVSLGYYRDLVDVDGVEIRLHSAVVYASLFRYDDEMIVNPHVYSRPASENPALHIRRGLLFDAYAASFDTVWQSATPWKGERV